MATIDSRCCWCVLSFDNISVRHKHFKIHAALTFARKQHYRKFLFSFIHTSVFLYDLKQQKNALPYCQLVQVSVCLFRYVINETFQRFFYSYLNTAWKLGSIFFLLVAIWTKALQLLGATKQNTEVTMLSNQSFIEPLSKAKRYD